MDGYSIITGGVYPEDLIAACFGDYSQLPNIKDRIFSGVESIGIVSHKNCWFLLGDTMLFNRHKEICFELAKFGGESGAFHVSLPTRYLEIAKFSNGQEKEYLSTDFDSLSKSTNPSESGLDRYISEIIEWDFQLVEQLPVTWLR